MAKFPELPSEQRKEAILQRSPFLRTFLDQTAQKLNPSKRQGELTNIMQPLLNEVNMRVGRNWYPLVVETHVISTGNLEIFHPKLDFKKQSGFIASLVLIGYEIGDFDDIGLFLGDLLARASNKDLDLLNPTCYTDYKKAQEVSDSILGLLKVGAYIKMHTNKETNYMPSEPFRKFSKIPCGKTAGSSPEFLKSFKNSP